MEKKHIFSNNIAKLDWSDFVNMHFCVEMTNENGIQELISKFYDFNLQITYKKHLMIYH